MATIPVHLEVPADAAWGMVFQAVGLSTVGDLDIDRIHDVAGALGETWGLLFARDGVNAVSMDVRPEADRIVFEFTGSGDEPDDMLEGADALSWAVVEESMSDATWESQDTTIRFGFTVKTT